MSEDASAGPRSTQNSPQIGGIMRLPTDNS